MLAVAGNARHAARCRRAMLGWVAVAGFTMPVGAVHGQPTATASAGEPPARLIAQALAYEHGEGVPQDQRKAAELYCEAARAGDPEAMFNLGWMYANARGVAHDEAVAASLFARAASFGHAHAKQMLKFVATDQGMIPACLLPQPDPDPGEAGAVGPADPFAALPPRKKRVADIVMQAAPTFGVDPRLALAIVAVESDFEPEARSIKDARGVMQLLSGTAARFHVANRMDIAANVGGGLAYLRWLLAYYEGKVRLAVAAYNAGEAAVDKYGGVPPYRETRDYVRRVLRLFPDESQPYDPAIAAPSPAFAHAESGSQ